MFGIQLFRTRAQLRKTQCQLRNEIEVTQSRINQQQNILSTLYDMEHDVARRIQQLNDQENESYDNARTASGNSATSL